VALQDSQIRGGNFPKGKKIGSRIIVLNTHQSINQSIGLLKNGSQVAK